MISSTKFLKSGETFEHRWSMHELPRPAQVFSAVSLAVPECLGVSRADWCVLDHTFQCGLVRNSPKRQQPCCSAPFSSDPSFQSRTPENANHEGFKIQESCGRQDREGGAESRHLKAEGLLWKYGRRFDTSAACRTLDPQETCPVKAKYRTANRRAS